MSKQVNEVLNKQQEFSKAEYLWLSSILALLFVPLAEAQKRSSKPLGKLTQGAFAGILAGCFIGIMFPLPVQHRIVLVIAVMLFNIFAAGRILVLSHTEGDVELAHTREYRRAVIAIALQILAVPLLTIWQALIW